MGREVRRGRDMGGEVGEMLISMDLSIYLSIGEGRWRSGERGEGRWECGQRGEERWGYGWRGEGRWEYGRRGRRRRHCHARQHRGWGSVGISAISVSQQNGLSET